MFEKEKQEVIDVGIKLDRYGLIALSGGNISLRLENGEILMTPSGMVYEDLYPEDIILMDLDGKIIEGKRRPSVDNVAIRHILKKERISMLLSILINPTLLLSD